MVSQATSSPPGAGDLDCRISANGKTLSLPGRRDLEKEEHCRRFGPGFGWAWFANKKEADQRCNERKRPHGSSSARSTWNDEYVHFLLVRCLELRLAGGTQKLLSWFVTASSTAALGLKLSFYPVLRPAGCHPANGVVKKKALYNCDKVASPWFA